MKKSALKFCHRFLWAFLKKITYQIKSHLSEGKCPLTPLHLAFKKTPIDYNAFDVGQFHYFVNFPLVSQICQQSRDFALINTFDINLNADVTIVMVFSW